MKSNGKFKNESVKQVTEFVSLHSLMLQRIINHTKDAKERY